MFSVADQDIQACVYVDEDRAGFEANIKDAHLLETIGTPPCPLFGLWCFAVVPDAQLETGQTKRQRLDVPIVMLTQAE